MAQAAQAQYIMFHISKCIYIDWIQEQLTSIQNLVLQVKQKAILKFFIKNSGHFRTQLVHLERIRGLTSRLL